MQTAISHRHTFCLWKCRCRSLLYDKRKREREREEKRLRLPVNFTIYQLASLAFIPMSGAKCSLEISFWNVGRAFINIVYSLQLASDKRIYILYMHHVYTLRHAFVRDRISLHLLGFVCSFEIERLRARLCFRDSDRAYHVVDFTPKLKTVSSNRLLFEGKKKRRKIRQIHMYNDYDEPYLIKRPFRNLKKNNRVRTEVCRAHL